MKITLLAGALLGGAGVAMADGVDRESASAQTVTTQDAVQDREQAQARKKMRRPQSDLRHCLDRERNEAIIRCYETRHKR